ncbi:MAG: acetyltransferase [Candidatus Muproteobacteria bacterium RBG_16_65_34]|uniref:Acetyltransferase n=1 Tax=Candidatus Muproteobacteria bacterium RBG_16_65_34 TaxID=1817760 RepID=A0A1F6TS00_9PROT|nr:MAG: acetyltransferase [Candidatus Muproteobacteria bacterium RBG_16_65_34]
MYLKHKKSGDLVEVLDLEALFDPFQSGVRGRFHAGEELQEPATFEKTGLVFPSGEGLPRCWTDAHYREKS